MLTNLSFFKKKFFLIVLIPGIGGSLKVSAHTWVCICRLVHGHGLRASTCTSWASRYTAPFTGIAAHSLCWHHCSHPCLPKWKYGHFAFPEKKKEKGHSDLMLRSLSAAWFLDPHFWGLEYGLGCVCVCFKALEQETGRPEMFCFLWTLGQSLWLSGPQFPQLFKPGNWKKQVNFITYSFGQKLLQALHCVISFWGRSYALAPV